MGWISFFLLTLLLIENGSVEPDGKLNHTVSNVIAKMVEEAEVAIVNSYERKVQEFKKDFLRPKFVKDVKWLNFTLESFLQLEGFRAVQWNEYSLLVAASRRATSIFRINFTKTLHTRKLIEANRFYPFYRVDLMEVLLNGDDLWLFEASKKSKELLITRFLISSSLAEESVQKKLSGVGKIMCIHPFVFQGTVNVALVSAENPRRIPENREFKLFTFEENSRLVLIKPFYCNLDIEVKNFNYKERNYFLLRCGKNITLLVYDPEAMGIQRIIDLSGTAESLVIYQDQFSQRIYLVLREGKKATLYWFGDKLLKLKEFPIEPFSRPVNVLYSNFITYLSTFYKEKFSIFHQTSNGSFELLRAYNIPCGGLEDVDVLSYKRKINVFMYCASHTGIQIRLGQLTENSGEELTLHSKKVAEKCLDQLQSTLERSHTISSSLKLSKDLPSLNRSRVLSESSSEKMEFKRKESASSRPNIAELTARTERLTAKAMELGKKMKLLEAELPFLMTFEGDQHIRTSIKVPKLIANYSNILALNLKQFNDLPIEDYKERFLLVNDDQVVTTDLYFDKVITKNLNTDLLSDNSTSISPPDLMNSRVPDQVVTGSHSFLSLEVKRDISRFSPYEPIEINGIKSEDFITTASDVTLDDLEVSQTLRARHELNVGSINGVRYEDWSKSLFRLRNDSPMVLDGTLIVNGNVRVAGDVKAPAINGLEVSRLYKNAAKKSANFQVFTGPVKFVNLLEVSVVNLETVNNTNWTDFLRLKHGKTEAKFFVDNGIIEGNLNSDSINKLDFDKDLLVSGPDQTIKGRLTFTSDLEVSGTEGITMDVGATINGFDPSLHFGYHTNFNDIINHEVHFDEDLMVNGDVRIETINGVDFPDLENKYWRKSVYQRIPVSVKIQNAIFRNKLRASSLNGQKISDYWFTNVDQVITGQTYFMNNITVLNDVELAAGKKVDGVSLSSLRDSAITFDGLQTISGMTEASEIEIEKLEIKDGLIKNVKIDDELFGGSKLYHGKYFFEKPLDVQIFHVKGDLKTKRINARNSSTVLLKKPNLINYIKGIVSFEDLGVDNITLTQNLNGRNFDEWMKKTISLDSPLIFSQKVSVDGNVTFTGSLDIHRLNLRPLDSYLAEIGRDCSGCKIKGKKVFARPLQVGNLMAERINGINLKELATRLLSRKKDQLITGRYHFNAGLTAGAIRTSQISDINVDEIVLTNEPSEIKGPILFRSDLIFDELSSNGLIDGCNVKEALDPTITKEVNLVSSDVSLAYLKIEGNISMGGRLFSGPNKTDLLHFLNTLARKSKYQEITGTTVFKGPVYIEELAVSYVNDLQIEEFLEKISIKKISTETHCDVEFEELSVDKIITNDLSSNDIVVNGVELRAIQELGIQKGVSLREIAGRKVFLSGATVGSLVARGTNNFLVDSYIKLADKHIDQHLEFKKPITVKENLQVKGLIYKMDPVDLFKIFADTKTRSDILPKKFDNMVVKGNFIGTSINGLRFDDLALRSAETLLITGKKTIKRISVAGDIHIDRINGFELDFFKKWSGTPLMSGKFLQEIGIPENSNETGTALKNIAFESRRLNSINFEYAKGLHRSFLHISLEDASASPGYAAIKLLYSPSPNSIYIIIEYENCLKWKQCPCFETQVFKILDSKLRRNSSVKGQYIPFISEDRRNHLLYYFSWCSDNHLNTTFNHLNSEDGQRYIINKENKYWGIIKNVLQFSNNGVKRFAVLAQTNDFGKGGSHLIVLNSNFKIIWETRPIQIMENISIKKVCNTWYLLVTSGQNTESSNMCHEDETLLYIWDEEDEKFFYFASFPPAVGGEMVALPTETLIVLALKEDAHREKCDDKGNVKIFRSKNCFPFTPFRSLPVRGASSFNFFTENKDLFLVSTSMAENSVLLFKRVHFEGFKEVGRFSMPSPMMVKHFHSGDHFLVVASQDGSLVLLRLNFIGATIPPEINGLS